MSPSTSREPGVFGLPGCVLIGVCRCVIGVMLMGYECCAKFIRTQVTVCLTNFRLLVPEFNISELRLQLIHWSLRCQGVVCPNLRGVSCRSRFECMMDDFPTLCLTPERFMSLPEHGVNRWLLP